jgi:hypothetical protein
MSADRDDEVRQLREALAQLKAEQRAMRRDLAAVVGDVTELWVAQGVELKKALLTFEQLRRADAELARALGGVLVETQPKPKPRPKPDLRLVADNDRPPEGGS